MKINLLFIFATTVGALGIAFAEQTKTTPDDHQISHQPKYGQEGVAPNSKGLTMNSSGATWGLHEPLKNCFPCHGYQPEQVSPDKPHLIAFVPELCYGCHKEYISSDEWVHGPVAMGDCLFCHEPHKTDNQSLLNKPIPELCYQCHEAIMLQSVANHSDKSYAHCNDCHDSHASPGRMLLKQEFLKTDAGLDFISKHPSILPQSVFVDSRGSLGGLSGVKVVAVIEESDLFKRYGLTEDSVRKKLEMRLRRNGIRIIDREEPIQRQSWLYVHLRLMEVPSQNHLKRVNALSGSINMYLRQKVELLGAPGDSKRRFCTATTWDTGGIMIWGTTQVDEGLDQTIEILAKKFSKDYMDANSGNRTLPPISSEN